MVTSKRKLPVLQSAPDPESRPRPPWQWVGFGTVMIFTAWLPLAYGAAALAPGDQAEAPAPGGALAKLLLTTLIPLATATTAGGFLVGRYGAPSGVREAVLSGLVTGLVAVAMTALSGPFSPLSLLVVALTTGFAGVGGMMGVRGRGGA